MTKRKLAIYIAAAAFAVASLPGAAMAQATGKENNATSGSEPGVGPKSGPEDKGTPGASGGSSSDSMKGDSSGSMKDERPTSAGSKDEQSKDLRGHSETPTTGSGK